MTPEQIAAAEALSERRRQFHEARLALMQAAKRLREALRTPPPLPALLRRQAE